MFLLRNNILLPVLDQYVYLPEIFLRICAAPLCDLARLGGSVSFVLENLPGRLYHSHAAIHPFRPMPDE
jgi:hypothetical protein